METMNDAFLLSRAALEFQAGGGELGGQLSAAVVTPDGSLWLGSDELPTVERLSQVAPCVFGAHERFQLGDFVTLPAGEREVDIEGLDYADHYLWITGSHSLKRKKAKGKRAHKDIARLARVQPELNRYLLARIPLVGDRLFTTCSHPDDPSRTLTAAALSQHDERNALTEALQDDEHLGPFFDCPLGDKENGFNIEGLATRGDQVFLGLRGPVLDGWAMLLELELEEREPGVLTPRQKGGRAYRKHFLDLEGLGIRELQFIGDDLLVLAGPTMKLEGEMALYRLRGALGRPDDSLASRDDSELELLFALPWTRGADHAEGLACLPCLGEPNALLIVYDSPHPTRVAGPGRVFADIFQLPS
jgi:hypothetical protein